MFVDRRTNGWQFHSRMYRGHTLGLPDEFKEKMSIKSSDARTILNMVVKRHEYSPLWTIVPSNDRKSITILF